MRGLPKTGFRCFTYIRKDHQDRLNLLPVYQDMISYVFRNYKGDKAIMDKILTGDYRYIFTHNDYFVDILSEGFLWDKELVNGDNYEFVRQLDGHLRLQPKDIGNNG